MISVIRKPVIAAALQQLRAQKTHPLFAGYLHLCQLAAESGRLDNLKPDFTNFYRKYFRVKDHPLGYPYVRPFTSQKASRRNLWLNENVAGSYAPSSLRPEQPFRKVVKVTSSGSYSLAPNHAELAFRYLLDGERVSAPAIASFIYRDFGLLDESLRIHQLVAAFAFRFGFSTDPLRPAAEFNRIFDSKILEQWPDDWLEPWSTDADGSEEATEAKDIRVPMTRNPIRTLSAGDFFTSQGESSQQLSFVQELRIKGLLSFGEETTFAFGRLNLLVGPNGSGKSNMIDCLRLFQEMPIDIQARLASEGFEAWLFNGLDKQNAHGELQLVARGPVVEGAVRHQIRLGPPSSSGAAVDELIDRDGEVTQPTFPLFVGSYRTAAELSAVGIHKRRRVELTEEQYNPFQSILSQIRDFGQYPEVTSLGNLYSRFRIYSEWTFGRQSKLRRSASPSRTDPQLSEQMDDLPATLNALLRTETHQKIRNLLQELKETYRDYVTRIVFGRVGLELVEAPFDRLPIPAQRLSDGTLRFLALAAILLRPNPAPVICLEEPELGMHPDMIRMVANMIVEASSRAQLIISTHSEHLLTALQDHFDVLFAFDGGPAGSTVQRFSNEEYQKWRSNHNLGELWSSGELGGVRY
ncbi:MAG TPA: AAA family ATPase [Gemmataceae bacterium]|jgi:predicted ATPase|nr:AAA family ATPase [Gemmataceae bacterium]